MLDKNAPRTMMILGAALSGGDPLSLARKLAMAEDRSCKTDDCDLRHCRQCGGHNFESGDVCDACQIEAVQSETEQVTKNFGGDHEAAARFYGW